MVDDVERRFGRLDGILQCFRHHLNLANANWRTIVLINNAGQALQAASDSLEDVRSCWAKNLDCLFTSQVLVTKAFMPLLRKAENPRVIAMSSARGSLTRNQALQVRGVEIQKKIPILR